MRRRFAATIFTVHGLLVGLGWFIALFVAALVASTGWSAPASVLQAANDTYPLGRLYPYAAGVGVLPGVWLALTMTGGAELAPARRVRRGSRTASVIAGVAWATISVAAVLLAVGGWPAPELLVATALVHMIGALAMTYRPIASAKFRLTARNGPHPSES